MTSRNRIGFSSVVVFALAGISSVLLFACTPENEIPTSIPRVLTADPTPSPNVDPRNGFRPDGGFEFASRPRVLKEFVWLSVITGTAVAHATACAPRPCTPQPIDQTDDWRSWPPKGILITEDDWYNWKSADLSQDHFSFITEQQNGISYQFEGRFAVDGYYEKTKPEGIVLTGRLTKLTNGRSGKQEDVSLIWFSWEEVDSKTFRRVKRSARIGANKNSNN